jgi:glycosyltransferase involved in cell wall biosynthesis
MEPMNVKSSQSAKSAKSAKTISIITIVYNNATAIRTAVESVLSQDYPHVEYVVIDGASTDGTLQILQEYAHKIDVLVSEPDKGIYNALNKGISKSTGDIVGILHADDVFNDNHVLSDVAAAFTEDHIQGCYGNLEYISADARVVRYWDSGEYRQGIFNRGWMPPHPTLFLAREVFEKYGLYNERMKIAADYEFMLWTLHVNKIPIVYIPKVITRMKVGGASNKSLLNIIRKTREDLAAWSYNQLRRGGKRAIILKNVSKIPQFFRRLQGK